MEDDNKTGCRMEKMEDDDVTIFSSATLTLACAVDMLNNEKAKNQEM